jgi:hypothetical protein
MANIHVHSDRSFREQLTKHHDEVAAAIQQQAKTDEEVEGSGL